MQGLLDPLPRLLVPELIVAVQAIAAGYPGILLGNVVASNIANVLVVAGTTAVIYPVAAADRSVQRDSAVMVAATLVLAAFGAFGSLHRLAGSVLLAGLVGVLSLAGVEVLRAQERWKTDGTPLEWVLELPSSKRLIGVFLVAGVVGLPLGARMVVESAVAIATRMGVTETMIGLSIVAFSTSLPELATTAVAAYRKGTGLVLGTIVGSNIFNIVLIMGVAALFSPSPIPLDAEVVRVDLPVMTGVALLVAAFVWLRRPIGRLAGVAMVAAYAAYLGTMFTAR